jgi:hypothetical protein
MPYNIGEKGSYGCSGYPVVKQGTSEVMGCHDTKEAAAKQISAIEANENKFVDELTPKKPKKSKIGGPGGDSSGAIISNGSSLSTKSQIKEGDYVVGQTTEGIVYGRVEHVMLEGGTYGEAGSEYAIESTPEDPAMAVRVFEYDEEEGWSETPYSIGMRMSDAELIDALEGYEMEDNKISKAETYSPNDGMKAAARRAIKWKEDGKSKGAGTPVGWGRARDIVAGRSMSLSIVKRMYSFFSRHEVDKKGEGFYSGPNFPSKGRVMWDAWGGDAGFSWSRAIVKRESDKALFADFGKDYTTAERMVVKAISTGSMVSWNSSGGTAEGKITRIIRSGSYNVPGTEITLSATEDDPVAVIRLYRDEKPTETIVAHKLSTLRSK